MGISTWANRNGKFKFGLICEQKEKEFIGSIKKIFEIRLYYGYMRRTIEISHKTQGWRL